LKQHPGPKQLLYIAVIIFSGACFFISCSKTNPVSPYKYNTKTSTGNGNTNGNPAGGIITNPDSTTALNFSAPDDVAVDAAGNLYVADYGNNLIRKISPAGAVSTLAGSGNIGAINGTGTSASFNGPSGLAVDATGNVYVADAGNNLIRKITPAGLVSTLAGTIATVDTSGTTLTEPVFSGPSGVAVDASGNVYVADAGNNQIRVVSPAGIISTFAGTGGAGAADGAGTSATFNNPTGVAVDASGNVYVADLLNNMIRKITPAKIVSTLAGKDSIGSSDGKGSSASFYFPNSLAVDASGNIYVTDDINNLIRKITPDGTVSTLAGSSIAGHANGNGTTASFNDPAGIALDASGNAYVADANNNLIRKISPAGVVTTVAGMIPGIGVIRTGIYARYHMGPRLSSKQARKIKV
jgi:sugar lactone lactonase YvrE